MEIVTCDYILKVAKITSYLTHLEVNFVVLKSGFIFRNLHQVDTFAKSLVMCLILNAAYSQAHQIVKKRLLNKP